MDFDPFKTMEKIDDTLSEKEKYFLGVGYTNHQTDDIKFFFNKERTVYLIAADYHDMYKDEHPIDGKIIGIAAMKNARGLGITDKLLSDAKDFFKDDCLVAEIDKSNVYSRRLFERCGFKKIKEDNNIDFYIWKGEKHV